MPTSKPITIQVSDVVNWFKHRELVINEDFQRRGVWSSAAKPFFIDTILHELPIPKVFIRSKVDVNSFESVREIVDGQQRIRAIVDFADNKLKLTKRSKDYAGLFFRDLDDESKAQFLSYLITAEQLFNADDDAVIDIFARINSYTVPLNPAEKRNAEFQTALKFSIRGMSQQYAPYWERYKIFSTQQRLRLADDQFIAQLYMLVLQGFGQGGETAIGRFYRTFDDKHFEPVQVAVEEKVDAILSFLMSTYAPHLRGLSLLSPVNLLLVFTIVLYARYGSDTPIGEMPEELLPVSLLNPESQIERLISFGSSVDSEELGQSEEIDEFREAAKASTHRLVSRLPRLKTIYHYMCG